MAALATVGLYGVKATDPLITGLAIVLLGAVATAASFIPVERTASDTQSGIVQHTIDVGANPLHNGNVGSTHADTVLPSL